MCAYSNILYIHTTNLAESIVYKLRLSNQPVLTEYSRRNSKNIDKSIRYAFYKN